jgi:hypothetical protein
LGDEDDNASSQDATPKSVFKGIKVRSCNGTTVTVDTAQDLDQENEK